MCGFAYITQLLQQFKLCKTIIPSRYFTSCYRYTTLLWLNFTIRIWILSNETIYLCSLEYSLHIWNHDENYRTWPDWLPERHLESVCIFTYIGEVGPLRYILNIDNIFCIIARNPLYINLFDINTFHLILIYEKNTQMHFSNGDRW